MGGEKTSTRFVLTADELRHESLLKLEGLYPVIHGKIVANLNLHLATRLMATTEIARGR